MASVHQCRTCLNEAEFACLVCNTCACFSCLFMTRYTYNAPCSGGKHMFVALVPERSYRIVKATNAVEAKAEGRKFAYLMCRIFQRNLDVPYEDISEFVQYVAMELLGYRDAEIFRAWVSGAMPIFLDIKTPEELGKEYAAGNMTFEQFQTLLVKALQPPKTREDSE